MALLDAMESILESLRETTSSTPSDKTESGEKESTSYRSAIDNYRTELLDHLAEQKKSVTEALPIASASDVTSVRKKMDSLSTKLNRLKQELKDLEA